MNRNHQLSVFAAALLGLGIAMGSIGCLLSAFGLTLLHPAALWGGVFLTAVLYGQCLPWKQGPVAFACLLVLAAGYLFRQTAAAEQTKLLLQHLSWVYDRAYHWGALSFEDLSASAVDLPLGIWAGIIALTAVRTMCLAKRCWLPVLTALVPFAACVVVTDTVPGERYLFLLFAGLLLLILPSSVRREDRLQGLRLTAAILLPVGLGLGSLFLTIPQEGYVNRTAVIQENLRTAAEHFPALLEDGLASAADELRGIPAPAVDLARLGQRIPFTYPVMEVFAEKGGTLYLREQDYDRYDGHSWTATEDRPETFSCQTGNIQSLRIRTRGVRQVRYLPYYPTVETALEGGCLENPERAAEYTLSWGSLPDNWRQTAYRSAEAVTPEALAPYLALPETTRQTAAALLENSFRPGASHTDKADIIAALVTDCAGYSLAPEKMPAEEPDFALWFWQKAESGYCIHFATTATVLLRAAGVPARYVTGYLAETIPGETVTVTESDSHAWAEYYEPNLGCWIPLEATPAEAESIPTPAVPDALPAIAATEPETPEPSVAVISAAPEPVPEIPRSPSDPSAPGRKPFLLLLLIPIAGFVLAVQRTVRLELRRRRRRKGSPNAQALHRFREAEHLARLLKETPAEELIELAQKAKYSQHTLTAEELLAFDSYCRSCLRRLMEKPVWMRLFYRYIHAVC